jgi:hypothetical protein
VQYIGQHPAQQRADDADDEVGQQAVIALHDLLGDPAGEDADDDRPDETNAVHDEIPLPMVKLKNGGSAMKVPLPFLSSRGAAKRRSARPAPLIRDDALAVPSPSNCPEPCHRFGQRRCRRVLGPSAHLQASPS